MAGEGWKWLCGISFAKRIAAIEQAVDNEEGYSISSR
jgi:hypothetical protein